MNKHTISIPHDGSDQCKPGLANGGHPTLDETLNTIADKYAGTEDAFYYLHGARIHCELYEWMLQGGYYDNKPPGDDYSRQGIDASAKYSQEWQSAAWEFVQGKWSELGVGSIMRAELAQYSYQQVIRNTRLLVQTENSERLAMISKLVETGVLDNNEKRMNEELQKAKRTHEVTSHEDWFGQGLT